MPAPTMAPSAAGKRAALAVLASLALAASWLVAGLAVPASHAALSPNCPAPGGAAIPEATAAAGEVVFSGHGYGHNLGMSQYGAQGAARLGCTYTDIVTTYYPTTSVVTKASPSRMLLWMLQGGTSVQLEAKTGPLTWTLAGCSPGTCPPVQPAGARWSVQAGTAGAYQLLDAAGVQLWQGGGATQAFGVTLGGTVTAVEGFKGAASYLSRTVRWDQLHFSQGSDGLSAKLSITAGFVPEWNATGTAMDKYLWGLGEVPISWTNRSHEALRAQAVAARTYALNKIYAGTTTLFATTVHQYYTGYTREKQDIDYRSTAGLNLRWADAVRSTSGQVLVNASGAVIPTFYTSSHGGIGEDERYVWGGTTDMAYIGMIDDSQWDLASSNSYRSWARGFSRTEVAAKLGFDSISALSIAEPLTQQRLAGLSVTGTIAGQVSTKRFAGDTVRAKLGLPSPGFRVTVAAATGGNSTTGSSTTLVLAPKPTPATPTSPAAAWPLVVPTPTVTGLPTTAPTTAPTVAQPAPLPTTTTTTAPPLPVPSATPTKPNLPPTARAPYAPRNVRAFSGAPGGPVTANLRWSAETSSGGVPVAGFYVRIVKVSAQGTVLAVSSSPLLPASTTSWQPKLAPGSYQFQVRAANAVGRSALSVRSPRVIAR